MEIITELLRQRTTLINLFAKMCEAKCNSCAELVLKAIDNFDTNYKETIKNSILTETKGDIDYELDKD